MSRVVNFDDIAAQYCKSGLYLYDDDNSPVLRKIFAYIERKQADGIDLSKGICLMGPTGTGKSVIMKTLAKIQGYAVDNIPSLPGYYSQKGFEIFDPFNKRYRTTISGEQVYNHRMFNDIGREVIEAQYMGNKIDVVAQLIYDRYELFQNYGIKTNFTTNYLTDLEFINRYGVLNYGRIKEMCNFLELNGESRR